MASYFLNVKQISERIGVHPHYFREWQAHPNQERFRLVVKEFDRGKFKSRDYERWLNGAEY